MTPSRPSATAFGPSARSQAPSVSTFSPSREAMQRSSASIGSLAAALAKAQRELTNPDKSLVATIPAGGPGATEKTFRYASLSNGLDIVRKTLGQHEIATVQTTSLDQSAGIINLTTVLAHSSGEWIASDWPVCAISETAAPHRMGAALTYARRYALFTLVGIAGEDDLDAPDVTTPANPVAVPEKPAGNNNGHLNGSKRFPAQRAPLRHPGGQPSSPSSLRRVLAPDESLELRTRLIAELDELDTVDGATLWARRSLAGKNRLNTADAQLVEDSFRAKLESSQPQEWSPTQVRRIWLRQAGLTRTARKFEREASRSTKARSACLSREGSATGITSDSS